MGLGQPAGGCEVPPADKDSAYGGLIPEPKLVDRASRALGRHAIPVFVALACSSNLTRSKCAPAAAARARGAAGAHTRAPGGGGAAAGRRRRR
jgi:hypothetical protein